MRTVKESDLAIEPDLDKTDELPVLDVAAYEAAKVSRQLTHADAENASDADGHTSIDLPALIDSVQKAEARIAQQSAEHDILERELREARGLQQESSQNVQRVTGEMQGLRDSLANREQILAQAMHSLGERDTALAETRREQAKLTQQLDETKTDAVRVHGDLESARGELDGARTELIASIASIKTLRKQIERGEAALLVARRESDRLKAITGEYLERLRSREWRRHHAEGSFRDLDAQLAAAQDQALRFERQTVELNRQVATLGHEMGQREEKIRSLESAAARDAQAASTHAAALHAAEQTLQQLSTQIAGQASAHSALRHEHSARIAQLDQALDEGQRQNATLENDFRLTRELLEAARGEVAQQRARMEELDADFASTVIRLQDVRRPADEAEAEVQRLNATLAAKVSEVENAETENQQLQSSLERSRGALQEREFLIRRLEHSATSNAQVLGRLQTSIERLGSTDPSSSIAGASAANTPAALVRLDGAGANTPFTLGNRVRVGRAPENDLCIESSSVSRHHAVIMSGRHTIIEDLNSTNGVLINGRRTNRQKLKDGDIVVIGEVRFRFADGNPLLPDANPVSFAPEGRA